MGNLLQYILEGGTYSSSDGEAKLSTVVTTLQTAYGDTAKASKMTPDQRTNIISILNQVLELARKNRNSINVMITNLQASQTLLQQQVDSFKKNDIMKQLNLFTIEDNCYDTNKKSSKF